MKRIAIPFHQFVTTEQSVVVAMPMYRHVSTAWLFNWWQMWTGVCVGMVAVEGVRLPIAMTQLVADALRMFPSWKWLVVLEDDVIPPPDAFNRVAAYNDEYDIVTALHVGHEPPYDVLAFKQVGDTYKALDHDTVQAMADKPGLYEVDAVPMGFTAISRHLLEDWDPRVLMWQPTTPLAGQDIHFCTEARKQGYRIAVDSALRCAHLTEVPIDYSHHQAAMRADDETLDPAPS